MFGKAAGKGAKKAAGAAAGEAAEEAAKSLTNFATEIRGSHALAALTSALVAKALL